MRGERFRYLAGVLVRLLLVGNGATLLIGLGWFGYRAYKGLPLSPEHLGFTYSVAALVVSGITMLALTQRNELHAQRAMLYSAPISSHTQRRADWEGRVRFAWYAGSVAAALWFWAILIRSVFDG